MRTSRQAVSSWIDSLSVKSPSFQNVNIPMSRMYRGDIIRLCELFHVALGKFNVELDTDRRTYQFNQDNYRNMENIDRRERAEAMFISYYGDSFYPIMFMILSPSCASINVNDKYAITYGFIDDALAIAGKHKRALDLLGKVRPSSAAAIILALDIVAVLALGLSGIYWTATLLSSLALIFAIAAISSYSGRHYYYLSLREEPPAGLFTRITTAIFH